MITTTRINDDMKNGNMNMYVICINWDSNGYNSSSNSSCIRSSISMYK